jgi:hypothetical protein
VIEQVQAIKMECVAGRILDSMLLPLYFFAAAPSFAVVSSSFCLPVGRRRIL